MLVCCISRQQLSPRILQCLTETILHNRGKCSTLSTGNLCGQVTDAQMYILTKCVLYGKFSHTRWNSFPPSEAGSFVSPLAAPEKETRTVFFLFCFAHRMNLVLFIYFYFFQKKKHLHESISSRFQAHCHMGGSQLCFGTKTLTKTATQLQL